MGEPSLLHVALMFAAGIGGGLLFSWYAWRRRARNVMEALIREEVKRRLTQRVLEELAGQGASAGVDPSTAASVPAGSGKIKN